MRHVALALVVAGLAIGCSSSEPRQTNPTFTVPPLVAETTSTTTTSVRPELEGPAADLSELEGAAADLSEVDGFIAAANSFGLTIQRPTGEVVAELARELVVRQPTWSRSGDQLVATLIDPGTGAAGVAVIDGENWTLETTAAARPYFFYSWNHAGDRIAALGPSSGGGTSVDFIDANGEPAADRTVAGGSMFIAFEPESGHVLVHANASLVLVKDFDSLEDGIELGSPGIGFQAPTWIPGTRQFLYARVDDGSTTLVREDVDSGDQTDLGPLDGFVAISVNPQGTIAAISHGTLGSNGDDAGPVEVVAQADQAVVELVDLTTGARTPILDEIGLWLEWSPTGERLLIGSGAAREVAWHVWDGTTTSELARVAPTDAFLQQYLPFADQYVESPRLWSPGGEAFVLSAVVDGQNRAVAVDAASGATAVLGLANVAFWSPGS